MQAQKLEGADLIAALLPATMSGPLISGPSNWKELLRRKGLERKETIGQLLACFLSPWVFASPFFGWREELEMRKVSEGAAGQTPSSLLKLQSSSAQVSSKTDLQKSVFVCAPVSRQLEPITKGDLEEPVPRGRSYFLVLAAVKVF